MLMNLIKRLRASARDERGFAMIFALMIMFVCTLLVASAILSSTEDVSLTHTYSNEQRAYDAALAGVDAYKYQLSANSSYWSGCPASGKIEIPRSTKEQAEGAPREQYEYETLPATEHTVSECKGVPTKKLSSIIESKGSASGTFRILATGIVKGSKCGKTECTRKIVATFNHPSFLDYVFVSNYEQVDPATVEVVGKEAEECAVYYKVREQLRSEGKIQKCEPFPWINEDVIEGPFHTNDAADIEGEPTFGRAGHKDPIEMVEGDFNGTPNIVGGNLITHGTPLYPPETGAELIQEAGTRYKGRTVIVLKNGGTMEVKNNGKTEASVPYPTNGVIAVEDGAGSCPTYTPFFPSYTNDTECGDVYVKGEYNQSLTIIAENDVIINGNVTTTGGSGGGEPTGTATLGLIADKYVRLYHPVQGGCESGKTFSCKTENMGLAQYKCNVENATAVKTDKATEELGVSLEGPVVDAALLSTKNSWGVDNFACGKTLGTVKIWGSIAENWRGRVTCCAPATTGYVKSYKWDSRLENDQPPDFLAPGVNSGWKIERETAPPE
jgi:hypothetical protein